MGKTRSLTISVFRRIRLRTYTIAIRSHVLWRNTVVYGAYMPCIRSFTIVYGVCNRRLGSLLSTISHTCAWYPISINYICLGIGIYLEYISLIYFFSSYGENRRTRCIVVWCARSFS